MNKNDQVYSKGDWIVHLYHGVGQIKDIESKCLDGKTVKYYKVIAKDSVFWVPVGMVDNERVRPLSSPKEILEAFRILREEPEEMDGDYNVRKDHIKAVMAEGDLSTIACIIRDLSARQSHLRLNESEERALNHFLDRLLTEWSACEGINIEDARQKLTTMLQDI
jgi:RNA polymerase-interacting CarD/CdnL/TRCF family regulator